MGHGKRSDGRREPLSRLPARRGAGTVLSLSATDREAGLLRGTAMHAASRQVSDRLVNVERHCRHRCQGAVRAVIVGRARDRSPEWAETRRQAGLGRAGHFRPAR